MLRADAGEEAKVLEPPRDHKGLEQTPPNCNNTPTTSPANESRVVF